MKKILFVLLIWNISTSAQNLQLHYDYGKGRKFFTATLEMFKPDKLGSTYFFVDMDYDAPGNKSMSLAYWEIMRYFNCPIIKNLNVTIQYNDGTSIFGPLYQTWLVGFMMPVNLKVITINCEILYRQMYSSKAPDYQITFVWQKMLFKDKCEFVGYGDIWSQDNIIGEKINIVQFEPQLWYILNDHISLGGEVEISKNFILDKNMMPQKFWQFMPTIACRWSF